jgi:hypothetical protein
MIRKLSISRSTYLLKRRVSFLLITTGYTSHVFFFTTECFCVLESWRNFYHACFTGTCQMQARNDRYLRKSSINPASCKQIDSSPKIKMLHKNHGHSTPQGLVTIFWRKKNRYKPLCSTLALLQVFSSWSCINACVTHFFQWVTDRQKENILQWCNK